MNVSAEEIMKEIKVKMEALMTGKIRFEELEEYIKDHKNDDFEYGQTLLMHAAYHETIDVVNLIIKAGANLDKRDHNGYTLLMMVAEEGVTKIVQMLLDNDANIEAKNNNGNTALMFAAQAGNFEIVKLLLDKGANKDERNLDGDTAFILAAKAGRPTTVEMLLDSGVDIEAKDINTALMLATKAKKYKTVNLLLKNGANISEKDHNGDTALMIAVKEKSISIADLLLRNGAHIDERDSNGNTLLMIAVKERQPGMVNLLLSKGANIDEKYSNGYRVIESVANKILEENESIKAARLRSSDTDNLYFEDAETINEILWNEYDFFSVNPRILGTLNGQYMEPKIETLTGDISSKEIDKTTEKMYLGGLATGLLIVNPAIKCLNNYLEDAAQGKTCLNEYTSAFSINNLKDFSLSVVSSCAIKAMYAYAWTSFPKLQPLITFMALGSNQQTVDSNFIDGLVSASFLPAAELGLSIAGLGSEGASEL